jgi:phage baseplate assembly protein W
VISVQSDIIGRGWSFPPRLDHRGRISTVGGPAEIEQAIRIIITTIPGQRVMRPEFGCRLHELVFAPNDAQTAGLAERYVRDALGRWEPRIDLDEVIAQPDPDFPARLLITTRYTIRATHNSRSLVYPFYLIPEE